MSERMTAVDDAWAAHGSIIGLARLARVNGQITAEELLRERDRARAVVKQAILDEGLKEYQARVDGLVEAAAEVEWAGRNEIAVWVNDEHCQACSEWSGALAGGHREGCPLAAFERRLASLSAALAAVRESQVNEGGV